MSAKNATRKRSTDERPSSSSTSSSSSSSSSSSQMLNVPKGVISSRLVKRQCNVSSTASAGFNKGGSRSNEDKIVCRSWTEMANTCFKETEKLEKITPKPSRYYVSCCMTEDNGKKLPESSKMTYFFTTPSGLVIQSETNGIGFKKEHYENPAKRKFTMTFLYGILQPDAPLSIDGIITESMQRKYLTEKRTSEYKNMAEELTAFYGLLQAKNEDFANFVFGELLVCDGRSDKRGHDIDSTADSRTSKWYMTKYKTMSEEAIQSEEYQNELEFNRVNCRLEKIRQPTICAVSLENYKHSVFCVYVKDLLTYDPECRDNIEAAKIKARVKVNEFFKKWADINPEDNPDDDIVKAKFNDLRNKSATLTIKWPVWKSPNFKSKEEKKKEESRIEDQYNEIIAKIREEPEFKQKKEDQIIREADKRIVPFMINEKWQYNGPEYRDPVRYKIFEYDKQVPLQDRIFEPPLLGNIGSIISPGILKLDPAVTVSPDMAISLKVNYLFGPFDVRYISTIRKQSASNIDYGRTNVADIDESEVLEIQRLLKTRHHEHDIINDHDPEQPNPDNPHHQQESEQTSDDPQQQSSEQLSSSE